MCVYGVYFYVYVYVNLNINILKHYYYYYLLLLLFIGGTTQPAAQRTQHTRAYTHTLYARTSTDRGPCARDARRQGLTRAIGHTHAFPAAAQSAREPGTPIQPYPRQPGLACWPAQTSMPIATACSYVLGGLGGGACVCWSG